ncbi:MAG: tetratricopeptide repeat protein [Planctomycetota bacterium]
MKNLLLLTLLAGLVLAPGLLGQDLLEEGKKLLEARDFEAALEKFDAVLESDENSFEARLGAARCHVGLGDPSTANFHAVKAERLKPDDLDAAVLVGDTFAAVGREKIAAGGDPTASFEESIIAFKKALRLAPKEAKYAGYVGWLAWQIGKSADSAEAYLKAAEIDPKNAEYPYLAAQRFADLPDADRALKAIDLAIARDGKNGVYHNYKGTILQFKQDLPGAGACFAKALASANLPDETAGQAAGGAYTVRAADKNWKGLAEDMAGWVKAHPKSDLAHWWLGYAHFIDGNFKEQLDAFAKLEKLGGRYLPEAQLYQGIALAGMGKDKEAIAKFEAAAGHGDYAWSDDQRRPVFQMRLIVGKYYARGDFDRAVEIAEKHVLPICRRPIDLCGVKQDIGFFLRDWGAQIDPKGRAAKARTAYEKSRKYYEEAVALFEACGGDLDAKTKAQIQNDCGLMYYYYDIKDIETSTRHYEKALEYDPNYDDALLNLARIHVAAERYAEAVALLERGSDRGDLVGLLREARRKLAEGGK